MSAPDNPSQIVSRKLQQAIEELRRDIAKVEMWADALNGFAQPVAEYDMAGKHLLGGRDDRQGRDRAS
jgi:hypothetical protein